jgi:hypothetical protein
VVQVRCDRVNVKMTGREGHALSEVLATTLGALASDTRGRANTRVAGQHVERSHHHLSPRVRDEDVSYIYRAEYEIVAIAGMVSLCILPAARTVSTATDMACPTMEHLLLACSLT